MSKLDQYMRKTVAAGILVNTNSEHGGSINSLAMEGKIEEVEFTAFDGIKRKANSILTACDFLKGIGQYKENQMIPVIWH